jgi:hypothetical protein
VRGVSAIYMLLGLDKRGKKKVLKAYIGKMSQAVIWRGM